MFDAAGLGHQSTVAVATYASGNFSTENQALAALLFLYRERLDLDFPWLDDLVRARILYRPGQDDWWCDGGERRSITQHLDELVDHGRVRQLDDGRFALAAQSAD